MFNFIKRFSAEAQTEDSTKCIPTAEEVRQQTQSKWRMLTSSEIRDEIISTQKKGKRKVIFSECYAPEDIQKELEEKGYNIESEEIDNTPWFTIKW